MVARKVLKRDVLVGREALDNRSMLDLHRPLERGLLKEGSEKDILAVREIVKHLLALAVGKDGSDGKDGGDNQTAAIRAVVGVPAEAMRVNKQQLKSSLQGMVDSIMIVSEPFAVAYGLDALLHTLIIDIGAGTSDFCIMNGRFPAEEDQKTLTSAGDSIDDHLAKLIRERYPQAQFSIHMVREWKEQHGFVGAPQAKVVVTAPCDGKPTKLDITQEMQAACESLQEPVAEAMLALLSRVAPEYQEKVRHNVILSGGGSLISGLRASLQQALDPFGGGKVRKVKDPVFIGSDGGLILAKDAPDADWDQLAQ
jgi:rod shape-determining protein MreB